MRDVAKDRLRETALALLARREHSAAELRRKLAQRGYKATAVETLMAELKRDSLQSDARYLETYLHARRERGYGPVRIAHELIERGLDRTQVTEALREADDERWVELAQYQLQRRFGGSALTNYRDRTRRFAFLERRGFTSEQSRAAIEQREVALLFKADA